MYLPETSVDTNTAIQKNILKPELWDIQQEVSPSFDMKMFESTISSTVEQVAPSVVSIIIKKDLLVYRSDPFGFFQQPAGTVKRQVWGWSW